MNGGRILLVNFWLRESGNICGSGDLIGSARSAADANLDALFYVSMHGKLRLRVTLT